MKILKLLPFLLSLPFLDTFAKTALDRKSQTFGLIDISHDSISISDLKINGLKPGTAEQMVYNKFCKPDKIKFYQMSAGMKNNIKYCIMVMI